MVDIADKLSGVQGVTYLVGNSPQELVDQLAAFTLPTRVIAVYGIGSKHFMWVHTMQKVRRAPKKTEE